LHGDPGRVLLFRQESWLTTGEDEPRRFMSCRTKLMGELAASAAARVFRGAMMVGEKAVTADAIGQHGTY
jgi:hypothetical protein